MAVWVRDRMVQYDWLVVASNTVYSPRMIMMTVLMTAAQAVVFAFLNIGGSL